MLRPTGKDTFDLRVRRLLSLDEGPGLMVCFSGRGGRREEAQRRANPWQRHVRRTDESGEEHGSV
jgi:hypothetical protein